MSPHRKANTMQFIAKGFDRFVDLDRVFRPRTPPARVSKIDVVLAANAERDEREAKLQRSVARQKKQIAKLKAQVETLHTVIALNIKRPQLKAGAKIISIAR